MIGLAARRSTVLERCRRHRRGGVEPAVVIGYLEDRRVLYNPNEMESPDHCVQSVLQIRSLLAQRLLEIRLPLGDDERQAERKGRDKGRPGRRAETNGAQIDNPRGVGIAV